MIFFNQMAIFATIFPLWFTSGMVWPLESLNLNLRKVLYLNPLSFPIESLRSVMLRGWSFTNTNVMIGYAVSLIYTLIFLLIDISMFERFSVQTFTSTFFKK
jgi:ABC-2 type transport system permease protein